MQKLKSGYLLWCEYHRTIPKNHRHSLGQRVDTLLVESIESVAAATFLQRETKLPYIRHAIRKLDTAKIMLLLLWESKSLDTKKYATLSQILDEVGKMLNGWHGQLQKQNSLVIKTKEK